MVFDGQAEGLDEGAEVGPGGDGFGDLVKVAKENQVFSVPVLPEIRAVHQMLHGSVGLCSAAEQLECMINMARDGMAELLALVRGNVVPAGEVGARKFDWQLGPGFVGFDRTEQQFIVGVRL